MRARLEREDEVSFPDLARTELMEVFHRQLREKTWGRDKLGSARRSESQTDGLLRLS